MKPKRFSVYEYGRLKLGQSYNGTRLDQPLLDALERFHSVSELKYFNLIHKGVEFREYVGVLQVGGAQIEVLPKPDKHGGDVNAWRDLLIGMLKEVGMFRVKAPSDSQLTLRSNSILELYFDIFISEVEYLIRTGLVKQYRRESRNQTALKGPLDFPRHVAKNLVHKERFLTNCSVYDHDHIWHCILGQAISLIRLLSQDTGIHSRVGALELNFPQTSSARITERTFNNLVYSRKTEGYRTAIEIARLLLLGFHPDLAAGAEPVLALMFDMNLLWESFVYHSLRKQFLLNSAPYSIRAQASTPFWRSENRRSSLRPDILIRHNGDGRSYVLDTKWKDVSGSGPSPGDLQQLFAYSQFFRSAKNALVYPGQASSVSSGSYDISTEWAEQLSCSLIQLGVNTHIRAWQGAIYRAVRDWMENGA